MIYEITDEKDMDGKHFIISRKLKIIPRVQWALHPLTLAMPGSEVDHADGAVGHTRKGEDTITGLRAKPQTLSRYQKKCPFSSLFACCMTFHKMASCAENMRCGIWGHPHLKHVPMRAFPAFLRHPRYYLKKIQWVDFHGLHPSLRQNISMTSSLHVQSWKNIIC